MYVPIKIVFNWKSITILIKVPSIFKLNDPLSLDETLFKEKQITRKCSELSCNESKRPDTWVQKNQHSENLVAVNADTPQNRLKISDISFLLKKIKQT